MFVFRRTQPKHDTQDSGDPSQVTASGRRVYSSERRYLASLRHPTVRYPRRSETDTSSALRLQHIIGKAPPCWDTPSPITGPTLTWGFCDSAPIQLWNDKFVENPTLARLLPPPPENGIYDLLPRSSSLVFSLSLLPLRPLSLLPKALSIALSPHDPSRTCPIPPRRLCTSSLCTTR